MYLLCARAVHCKFALSLIMAMEPLKSKCNREIIDFGVSKRNADLKSNTEHLHMHWQNVSIGKLFVNFYVNRKDSYDLLVL